MRPLFVTTMFLILALAGCSDDEKTPEEPDAVTQEDPPPATDEEDQQPEPPSGPSAGANATHDLDWAAPEDATVRPGVRINGSCTSNFIFTSPDASALYIGSAAHCFTSSEGEGDCSYGPLEPGRDVPIEGASEKGTLVYSSIYTMKENGDYEESPICGENDFALIEISIKDWKKVNPAMLHFGGPTQLANSTGIQANEKLLSYGRSEGHHDVRELEQREGYVVEGQAFDGWTTRSEFVTPGIPGDSGSGIITSSGEALGLLTTIGAGVSFDLSGNVGTSPGTHWLTNLDMALAYARDHAGIEARLATWDLLEEGVLPDVP